MKERELTESGGHTMLVQRTMRSGQNVNFDGNVVVLGDVNPGAEVIASGHVLVMGALRGVVHAGAGGFDGATITALELSPTQLRIASHITRPPDGEEAGEGLLAPETARIKDGSVIIEKYQAPR
ncbi:MAG: septum site-determining protein MinC [Clostridiales bacterium]|nr:septum site-determining protein MinC [Clostridiales bacterium]